MTQEDSQALEFATLYANIAMANPGRNHSWLILQAMEKHFINIDRDKCTVSTIAFKDGSTATWEDDGFTIN